MDHSSCLYSKVSKYTLRYYRKSISTFMKVCNKNRNTSSPCARLSRILYTKQKSINRILELSVKATPEVGTREGGTRKRYQSSLTSILRYIKSCMSLDKDSQRWTANSDRQHWLHRHETCKYSLRYGRDPSPLITLLAFRVVNHL